MQDKSGQREANVNPVKRSKSYPIKVRQANFEI